MVRESVSKDELLFGDFGARSFRQDYAKVSLLLNYGNDLGYQQRPEPWRRASCMRCEEHADSGGIQSRPHQRRIQLFSASLA